MSAREEVQRDAEACGREDYDLGNTCDPSRYCALPGSAWAEWYRDGYEQRRAASEKPATP